MFKLIPGIACVVVVVYPNGDRRQFIYLDENTMPISGVHDSADGFKALPWQVRTAIDKHFREVFSLPVGERAAHLKTVPAISVDVPE